MVIKKISIFLFVLFAFVSCNQNHIKTIVIQEPEEITEQEIDTINTQEINIPEDYVLYEDETIYTIFVHPLIISPKLAFDGDSHESYMNDWFVTSGEFKNALSELYKKNYILVKSSDIYEISADNKIVYKNIYLPKDKKPLVFSIDDLNYYNTMKKNGCAQYLYLDENNNLADKKLQNDEPDYGESIFILEDFIKEHPDFSLNGARGIIALTGYNGILGYSTHKFFDEDSEENQKKAIAVVNKLKEMGWEFASHTYNHIHPLNCSDIEIKADCIQWKNEVESLIGKTSIFIYPYGEEPKKSGQKILEDFGFKFFLAVGRGTSTTKNDEYLLLYRRAFDGVLLKYRSKNVFLDIDKVYSKPRK